MFNIVKHWDFMLADDLPTFKAAFIEGAAIARSKNPSEVLWVFSFLAIRHVLSWTSSATLQTASRSRSAATREFGNIFVASARISSSV